MKIEAVPSYQEIEVIGISKNVACDAINGTVERKSFVGRRILTLTSGFDVSSKDENRPVAQIAKGDGTRLIQTVEKADALEVCLKLGDDFASRKLTLRNVLKCVDTKDNVGCVIAYLKYDALGDNQAVLDKIAEFAPKMLAAHPDAFGDWMLVDNDGKRVIVYFYSDVDAATGKGVPQD